MTDLHLSPERVAECGLKPDSFSLIERARANGTLRLACIYEALRPGIRGSDMMRPAMAKLINLLDSLGISIDYNGSAGHVKKARITDHPSAHKQKPKNSMRGNDGSGRGEPAEPMSAYQWATPAPAVDSSGKNNSEDPILSYLAQIGQVKLLTPAEEISLAKRIRRGDAEAREHMIRANLRLVVKIAYNYQGCGLPLLDLISEGNIGLMMGVERFNPAKGAKFSTYGSFWIKQRIRRALANDCRTIRLPVHMWEKSAGVYKMEERLREELGREPDEEELAEKLGMSLKALKRIRSAKATIPISLDARIGEDEDSGTCGEIIPDGSVILAPLAADNNEQREILSKALSLLDQREAGILAYRFGLDGEKERTLEEVGRKFHVTRERIRQIQNDALKKLRKRMMDWEKPNRS